MIIDVISGVDPGFLKGGGGVKSIKKGLIFNTLPDFSQISQ